MTYPLSIISANVYPGYEPVEAMMRNLAAQTSRDFELVLVDAFYAENADPVARLAQELNMPTTHTPAMEAKHVGRSLHWELYNNALLLATSPWVQYHGVYRYLHRDTVSTIICCAARNTSVILFQMREDPEIPVTDNVEKDYSMDVDMHGWKFLQHSGFFSARRDVVLNRLNGYNEAIVNDHWVDCEMGARVWHIPLDVAVMARAILRLERKGHYGVEENGRMISRIGKAPCTHEENPKCIRYLLNALREDRRIREPVQRLVNEGFEWVRCERCGTLGVEDSDRYLAHLLNNPGLIRAPINVAGVGRNLARLDADLQNCSTLAEKVALISASHDNPVYLQP
jgi:hypothetical protein